MNRKRTSNELIHVFHFQTKGVFNGKKFPSPTNVYHGNFLTDRERIFITYVIWLVNDEQMSFTVVQNDQ